MTLSVGPQDLDGSIVLSWQGQIVAGPEGSELREKVQQIMKGSRNVVLDLREVSYIDSSGLGVLVSLYSTARAAHGSIKFRNLVKPVMYTRPHNIH